MSISEVLRKLCTQPGEMLIHRWNWKSAIFSSSIRACLFFCTNLTADWRAAAGAMVAEFIYRGITAGFHGAATQAFREAEPEWASGIAAGILLPLSSHTVELVVHVVRGTPRLTTSIIASVCLTIISTLFNQYAMRRGALIVGEGAGSVQSDLKRVPVLIAGFVISGPSVLFRSLSSLLTAAERSLPVPKYDAYESDEPQATPICTTGPADR